MRLNLSTPALFVASSLLTFGFAMPFIPRDAAWLQPLVRKATYSVVPVDGGPSATAGNGSPEITIIQTVTQIPAPTTQTIDITDYIVTTQTIEGPKTTETLVITITPSASPAQVTTTKYSVIDISAPPVTVIVTAPASSLPVAPTSTVSTSSTPTASSFPSSSSTSETKTSSSTQSLLSSTTSSKIPATSSTPLPSTTLTSIASSSTTLVSSPSPSSISSLATAPTPLPSSHSTSVSFTQTTLATITSSSTSTSTTSTSSKTYDDGMWHTHYPAWNATATVATPVSTPVGDAQKRGTITGLKALLKKNVITQA